MSKNMPAKFARMRCPVEGRVILKLEKHLRRMKMKGGKENS